MVEYILNREIDPEYVKVNVLLNGTRLKEEFFHDPEKTDAEITELVGQKLIMLNYNLED